MSQINLKDIYDEMRAALDGAGIEDSDFIARQLIKSKLDVSDITIALNTNTHISEKCQDELREFVQRTVRGEPLNRILEESRFWGLRFKVTSDVLDPRNDTETIVDLALKRLLGKSPGHILDMGTGTGCIIISLLTEWSVCQGVASDISPEALKIARHNAELNGVADRMSFVRSDWGNDVKGKFDLIVSNPPYISESEMTNLPESVKNYDPILALQAGIDGLDAYKKIIFDIKRLLQPEGIALLEIGSTQGEDVMRLVEDSGLFCHGVHPDMAGNPRVVEISFGEK